MQTLIDLCLTLEPKQLIQIMDINGEEIFSGHADQIVWNEKKLHKMFVKESHPSCWNIRVLAIWLNQ